MIKNYVLITGASSGIGATFAKSYAKLGHNLILVARRLERLEKLKEELTNVDVLIVKADLTIKEDREKIFIELKNNDIVPEIFINNAGNGNYGDFLDFKLEDHLFNIELNITSLTELSYLYASYVESSNLKNSHLVNVSSLASFLPLPKYAVYAGTKAYVRFLSEALHSELRPKGIYVTCICPGGTKTEFLEVAGQKVKKSAEIGMMSAQEVVDISIRAIHKRKKTIVTGILNFIASKLLSFVPSSLAVRIYNSSVEKV